MPRIVRILCLLAIISAPLRAQPPALPVAPIALHPDNPRYFLFRGKPLVLVTASEHYGSVINRPFNYVRYLDDAARHKMTMTRTFLLYRELQTPRNPSSPAKPESPDYLAPYPRTGPAKAFDGELAYDLDKWNPEYFTRLRAFLQAASDRGIVVELTLFSHTYNDGIWSLNPLNAKNNKQSIGKVEWPEYDSLKDKALVERQSLFARKIVEETSGFDNVYYEICNEPAGGREGHVTAAEVDAWLTTLADVVREELKKRNRKHLVFGTQAFEINKKVQELGDNFTGATWDAVNVHPHPYLVWQRRSYPLGDFMAKDLKLLPLRDLCVVLAGQRKPLVLDEDNAASLYRDTVGWTIHRKRAWTAVLSGAHYDYIDFSITVGSEAGTAASRRGLRDPMKHLSTFIHSFDFIHAVPAPNWISSKSAAVVVSALVVEGKDHVAYLADGRELSDAAAGSPIGGQVAFNLPVGKFRVSVFSPMTGEYSPGLVVEGGKKILFDLPTFQQDIVLRATRVE